jgi:hypothetical protein
MPIPVPKRIAAILEARRGLAPKAAASLAKLRAANNALDSVKSSLQALANDPKATAELRALADSQSIDAMRERLDSAIALQHRLHARFSRTTVNLGVSGQARVGKSQLLQTISGLGDDALPTGTGTPVTAVRSRIINSPESVAHLSMHDWSSFRDDVVAPYHAQLKLHGLPETVEQFRIWPYDEPSPDAENERNVMLGRLRMMRDTLGTYQEYLTGEDRTIKDLTELRRWVAYPKDETEARYLAVKDARIECPFPHSDLVGVGLIDLPGLGEIAASAEKHHLDGLREEVDYVLFVKRANEGMAYWKSEDAKARKLIDDARKPIARASDFVGIVSNEGGLKQETLDKMLTDIDKKANSGLGEYPLKLYRCSAIDNLSVVENLVSPVLGHLAERLPVMDAELLSSVAKEVDDTTVWVSSQLQFFQTAVLRTLPEMPGTATRVSNLKDQLRGELAVALADLMEALKKAARETRDDVAFTKTIHEAHKDIERWASDETLGRGKQDWLKMARSKCATDQTTAKLAADELNRIRVHVGESYCRLDVHLNERIEELVEQVGAVFVSNCGELLQHTHGRRSLELLADALILGEEPCPNMARAVRDLLDLRVNYRSHFHPRVRSALDVLDQIYTDPDTLKPVYTVQARDPTLAGTEFVLRDLIDLAVQGSYRVRQELLDDAAIIAKILFAAAEQFADSLIRSGTSESEFLGFCSSYRRELSPGTFDTSESQSVQVRSAKAAFSEAQSLLKSFEEVANA